MPNQTKNILAVHDFWQNANIVSVNTVIIVKASVVYTNTRTGQTLYRSKGPVEVQIDTVDDCKVIVSDLPDDLGCFGTFSTYWQEMKWENGVLTIKGNGNPKEGKDPYVVTIM